MRFAVCLGLGLFSTLAACSSDNFTGTDAAPDATDARADVDPLDGGALPVPEKLAEDGTADAGVGLGRVAVDGEYVYWIREDTTTVRRAPKAGGPSEIVKPANSVAVDDLALGANEVFVNGYNGGPFAYPKSGGVGTLLPLGCPLGLRISVTGSFVYYTFAECSGADKPVRVARSAVGADAGQFGLGGMAASEITGDVVADSTDVFVADKGGVGRLPPDLTTYSLIQSQAGTQVTALALDSNNLFARRSNALAIINRVSTNSVDIVPLAAEAIPIALNAELRSQLAQDGAYVYVSSRTGLHRIAKAPPHDKTPLYEAHGVVGVAQDAGYIYFSVPDLAAILRVKKPS